MGVQLHQLIKTRWLGRLIVVLSLVAPNLTQAAIETAQPTYSDGYSKADLSTWSAYCDALSCIPWQSCSAYKKLIVDPFGDPTTVKKYGYHVCAAFFTSTNSLTGGILWRILAACPNPASYPSTPYVINRTGDTPICERDVPCALPNTIGQLGQCEAPCITPNVIDPQTGKCEKPETYTLTLTPNTATIEPNQSATFTATVSKSPDDGTPANVTVSLDVKVDATSGGHDHGEKPINGVIYKRPQGTVAPLISNSNSFDITFKATDISGTHTVTATCEQCVEKTKSAEVTVKVVGLEPIPDSLFYALTETDPDDPMKTKAIGSTPKHKANHYLKPEAANYLLAIAIYYQTQPEFQEVLDPQTKQIVVPHPLLHVNDASLKDGGKFDLSGTWAGSHYEHIRGESVDIRMNEINRNGGGAIPSEHFTDFQKWLGRVIHKGNTDDKFEFECTKDKYDKNGNPIPPVHNRVSTNNCVSKLDGSHDTNRHFHLRLLGDK